MTAAITRVWRLPFYVVVFAALAAIGLVTLNSAPAQAKTSPGTAITSTSMSFDSTTTGTAAKKPRVFNLMVTGKVGVPKSTSSQWVTGNPQPVADQIDLGASKPIAPREGSAQFAGVKPYTWNEVAEATADCKPLHPTGVVLVSLVFEGGRTPNEKLLPLLDSIRKPLAENTSRVLENTEFRLTVDDPAKMVKEINTFVDRIVSSLSMTDGQVLASVVELIDALRCSQGLPDNFLGVTVNAGIVIDKTVTDTLEFVGVDQKALGLDADYMLSSPQQIVLPKNLGEFSANVRAGFFRSSFPATWTMPVKSRVWQLPESQASLTYSSKVGDP